MKNEQYISKDLGEVATLVTLGLRIRNIHWKDNIAYFCFVDKVACENAAKDYYSGKVVVNPRIFYDNLRSVKGKLYATEKGKR